MVTQKRLTIIVLLVAIFLSTFVLYTPKPQGAFEDVFSTMHAMETIAAISQDQHSVFDAENHEAVRLYLKDRLTTYLGASNVIEYHYDRSLITDDIVDYDIDNLLGIIPGDSDTAIMLVAHYDSRGHVGRSGELGESYGAADDGYGIAVLLEIARLYKDRHLENTIYILMTDGEETGLYGAHFAATETALMSHVGLVINIEARGAKGPAYMFETNKHNDQVLDLYREANYPVTYSLATAVYTVMPNSTDFTEFLAIEKNGLNFAVLNNLYYYHTPEDNYANVSPSSIQHYGEQIVPLVEAFVTHEVYSDVDYFNGTHDDVFFMLFTNLMIRYSEMFANVMHIVVLLALIGFIVLLTMNKQFSFKKFGKSFGLFGAMMGLFIVVGFIVAYVIAFYSKVPFSVTYVKTSFGDLPALMTLVGLSILCYVIYHKRYQLLKTEMMTAGSLFNLLLALLTGFTLSGASFLFLVIGLIGTSLLWFDHFVKHYRTRQIVYGIAVILSCLVLVPILYTLHLAITIGGLLALGVILSFYLMVLIPHIDQQATLKR